MESDPLANVIRKAHDAWFEGGDPTPMSVVLAAAVRAHLAAVLAVQRQGVEAQPRLDGRWRHGALDAIDNLRDTLLGAPREPVTGDPLRAPTPDERTQRDG